jgi:tellurite resistance protein
MDINRDNYEEYFLLYADNELTDSEKVAVIMFLKENKDLEEEFSMIHHTISKPEQNVILDDKSFLFKNNSLSLINDKNYEEIFALYHDNELTTNERNEVEQFLTNHESLQNQFELIGLARLTPEN